MGGNACSLREKWFSFAPRYGKGLYVQDRECVRVDKGGETSIGH